ncbi:type I-B CRISPR-associated protein Cas7/Cst2/DevR [Thermodesulfobacterium sp. TA1]|uniref:type I-B CRISPR-associated protein Cas7/Cst2/DevR n=1 Tax=Thermodesulfobacterium sp. TA1 TaxID=2234087 RepID=UPI001231BAD9|nr:type I-B CRISPR-associated protein Cas7/Cst2/DevR [Thermodesulfobacterium sp. TA1]QER42554.1 type I-B CRISPR-associated protein Cas7/Cst2/DevR [Thermodesulfobacterium sp. TA1]
MSNESNVKYISMDIVFYGNSLNYDWGGGTNYQELKKITKWDGRQYVLVSRYALRYSILHWANKLFPEKWKLAGQNELHVEKGEVVRLKKKDKEFLEKIFKEFPEFDLFGFMIAEKGSEQAALTRTSPVKISHAISLTPTNLDAHTMANLDMVRRAGGKGSNPVTIEEKPDFYVYNITIDVERIGKYLKEEHGDEKIGDIVIDQNTAKERVVQLIETVLNLKRDIKGRREDLSPWLVVLGIYRDGRYETFIDKIMLERKTHYKVKRTYRKEGDTEIVENEIEEGLMPLFKIGLTDNVDNNAGLYIYYRKDFCDYTPKKEELEVKAKEDIIKKIEEALRLSTEN